MQTIVCVLGIVGNSTTLFILNASKEMRKQPINVYLTVLALYDNGVLVNAILMLCIPNIYKLISTFQSPAGEIEFPAANQSYSPPLTVHVNMTDAYPEFDGNSVFEEPGVLDAFNRTLLDMRNESWGANMSNTSIPEPNQSGQDILYLYVGIVYPLAMISHTGSIWTTCLITAVSRSSGRATIALNRFHAWQCHQRRVCFRSAIWPCVTRCEH